MKSVFFSALLLILVPSLRNIPDVFGLRNDVVSSGLGRMMVSQFESLTTATPSLTAHEMEIELCLLNMGYLPSVRSRWLDVGQVPFLRLYGRDGVEVTKRAKNRRTSPISSHLDRKSLVNEGFIIWLSGTEIFWWDKVGNPLRGREWLHLARSRS